MDKGGSTEGVVLGDGERCARYLLSGIMRRRAGDSDQSAYYSGAGSKVHRSTSVAWAFFSLHWDVVLQATTERHQSTLAPRSYLGKMEEKYWLHTNGTLVLNHFGAVLIGLHTGTCILPYQMQ